VNEHDEEDDTPGAASPGNGAPAVPKDEPKGMAAVDGPPMPPLDRAQVETLRKERDELGDQLLRKRAEFENYRKRVERDKQQAGVDAATAVLKALVPSLDNLDRALEAQGDEASLRQGVELIRRDLQALLESQGVVMQDPVGQMFDPQIHQALSHDHVPGHPEGTIVEVFRKGYSFKDRLIRPALVKVAKGPDDAEGRGESGAVH
jgi:molecular chaperone GrpE